MPDPHTTKQIPEGGRRWWQPGSRGAALVEAAMVLPILILLTFGAIEYGLIYRDELRLTTAARSGARIGVADKDPTGSVVNADDDYQILQAVYSALGPLASKVVYVSIYNAADTADGSPPALCSGAGAASQNSAQVQCNVYAASDFTLNATGIENSSKDLWPASARHLTLDSASGIEPTYLGVSIKTTHSYITGIFGSSRTISEGAVFRYEPVGNTTHGNYLAPTTTAATTSTTNGASTTTTAAPTTTTGGGGTTTTTSCHWCSSTTSSTWVGTTTTWHSSSTTGPTTTAAPTTTMAPTTTTPPVSTTIIIIPT